ncbi:FMN reductase (NADPH) [Calothrix sp. HK-06]|nr:FMN reductase (NADPH) [Calothrix sp. HK-06]
MSNIVAIAGSPSHPSRTYGLLEYANTVLQQNGLKTDLISVRDLPAEDLIFGRYDSPALQEPKALLEAADGIIIATPIYKAAYTGTLKAFLDLLPQKTLLNKVVLPIGTGGAITHALAVDYTLKPVLSELGARHILGSVYIIDKQIQLNADAKIQLDEESEQKLKDALNELTQAVNPQSASKELAHVN